MNYNIIEDIVRWNIDRDCTQFDGELEYGMLHEELLEFVHAYPKTITDKFGVLTDEELQDKEEEILEYLKSEEFMIDFKANQLDALGDLIFVAVGSMGKIMNGDWHLVEDVLMSIIAANNTKTADKNGSGKITKPADFVGPEAMIKKLYKVVQDGCS